MQIDDRRTRFLSLAVMTLVFIVFMTALVYWAVNVASPRIQSKVFVNFRHEKPLFTNSTVEQLMGRPRFGLLDLFQSENHQ
jgi:hypothetical protein